jgi:hypothetical protein
MPKRMIRDWTDSEPVNALSAEAERLFVRLIMKADDYGLFTASPQLIRAACFPQTIDNISNNGVAACLKELVDVGLVVLYEANAKPFLYIRNFGQRLKFSVAKFPAPPASLVPEFPESGRTMNRVSRTLPGTSGNFRELPGTSGNFPVEEEVEEEVENPLSPPCQGGTQSASLETKPKRTKRARTPDEKAARALGLEVA